MYNSSYKVTSKSIRTREFPSWSIWSIWTIQLHLKILWLSKIIRWFHPMLTRPPLTTLANTIRDFTFRIILRNLTFYIKSCPDFTAHNSALMDVEMPMLCTNAPSHVPKSSPRIPPAPANLFAGPSMFNSIQSCSGFSQPFHLHILLFAHPEANSCGES